MRGSIMIEPRINNFRRRTAADKRLQTRPPIQIKAAPCPSLVRRHCAPTPLNGLPNDQCFVFGGRARRAGGLEANIAVAAPSRSISPK